MREVRREVEERGLNHAYGSAAVAAAVVASLCIHAARGPIQEGDPIDGAAYSKAAP